MTEFAVVLDGLDLAVFDQQEQAVTAQRDLGGEVVARMSPSDMLGSWGSHPVSAVPIPEP